MITTNNNFLSNLIDKGDEVGDEGHLKEVEADGTMKSDDDGSDVPDERLGLL